MEAGTGQGSSYNRNSLAALIALAALGWILILWSVANMSSPVVALMMPMNADWAVLEILVVWLMWAVMMGAMMLPSAIPMLVIHGRISAKREPEAPNASRWFLIAYLLTWAAFSITATFLQ